MTKFSMSSGGGKWPRARALPDGAKVRIAEIKVSKSRFETEITQGPKKGQKENRLQLLVVFEALEAGTTVAYKEKNETVPATPYSVGDKFVHYYGGVFAKDDGSGYGVSPKGFTALCFCGPLDDLGFEAPDEFEGYVNLGITVKQLSTLTAKGMSYQVVPASILPKVLGVIASTPAPAQVAPAQVPAAASAFEALAAGDQKLLAECLKEGPVSAKDLVTINMAKDLVHAQAILDSVPKLLSRKA